MRKEQIITLLVIVVILLLAGAYTWSIKKDNERMSRPVQQALSVGEGAAPYTDLGGNEVSLMDEVRESVVIVNSWASWSPDSAKELQDLAKLAETYAGTVSVVAINRAEPASTAERFLKTVGAAERVRLVLDPDDTYYRSIGGYAMPETIIYDAAGDIIHHHRGVLSYSDMVRYTEEALQTAPDQ